MALPIWTTANPDWASRLINRQPLIPFGPLFPDEAAQAMGIFRSLLMVDAAGSPTLGECSREWTLDFVNAIFGSYDHASGRRLIREFFLSISKKNGKSCCAAGIMITALLRNWRKSAEFIIVAPTIEVANNSFYPARDMVRAEPELAALLHVQEHYRTITHKTTHATLKVIAADNEAVSGKKAVGVLIDELWLFGKRPNAENMLREATGGLASRPEGFVIYLTTQSDEPPAGIFKQKLQYFRNVRDGVIVDPRSLPVLYEYPQAMLDAEAYRDPANFYIPNPNLGASVDPEFLTDTYEQAKYAGNASLAGFFSKHLNVELGIGIRGDRWPGAEHWAKQADRTLTYHSILDRSEVIVVGIDGGGLDDLFGLSVLGRDKQTKDWLCWSHAWCHIGVLDRRKAIASKLMDFSKAGELTIVDDRLDDITEIVEIVSEVKSRGLLAAVAVDPAGLGELVDAMDSIGVTLENKKLVGIGQGFRMMNAIKTAERRLANGTLRHSGSGLMAWCVANIKLEATATAIRATKQHAGDAKIDPAMAMFDACDLLSMNPQAQRAPEFQMLFVG